MKRLLNKIRRRRDKVTLLLGDCLKKLKNIKSDSIDLIYLDPPFFTQRKHSSKNRDNTIEYSFEDSWDNIDSYQQFIKERLIECHRVLKETGSIFLHCDKQASHYLRVTLDQVFGSRNFQSEIIWNYKRWSNSKKGLLNNHQNIYFYSKTNKFKFNVIYTDYSATTNIDQILQERARDENNKTIYKRDETGKVILNPSKKGVPLSDVWNIPYLNPKARERTGYPTQKPILLLERIIKIASDEGDTVLDPFCGSGTTLVAAHLQNRKYIGIDTSEHAIQLSKERLENPIRSNSNLLEKGIEQYQNKTDAEIAILNFLNATPVQRNKGIDGFLKEDYNNTPIPIKIQKENENLDEALNKLLEASQKRESKFKILVKTKQEEGLFDYNYDSIAKQNILILEDYELSVKKWLSNTALN